MGLFSMVQDKIVGFIRNLSNNQECGQKEVHDPLLF